MKYLKKLSNHDVYAAFIVGAEFDNTIHTNAIISYCKTESHVHYNPYVEPPETRLVAKFNVTSTSSPTQISFKSQYADGTSSFSSIEIDGVEQPSVVSAYTFDTLGEHTVKYTLKDPTHIGEIAFKGCSNLISLFIPSTVTTILNNSFSECGGILSITVDSNNTAYDSRNNCNAIIQTSTNKLIKGCVNTVIPNDVTSLGDSAFSYCTGLTNIAIPSSVTSIGGGAFYGCSGLNSLTIPNNVTNIGNNVIASCTSLTSVTIGSSVTSIGYGFGANCDNLISITSNATTAPTIRNDTFQGIKTGGTLTVPSGSSGYDTWMQNANYYLGKYNWTKVEQ